MSELESLEDFRLRARSWLADHMPSAADAVWSDDDMERWNRARSLQRKLFDGGFAGLCFPEAYGGRGLSRAYQTAFDEEALPYEMPALLNIPSFGIIAATLLDFGSEAQKLRHLPAILRGEEVWVQLLSEPTGGSDLASVMTRATLDGDAFVLSGSKVWTSGAYAADYGLCVARTNWEVPKHDGISVLIVKMNQPGVRIDRIRGVAGDDEFCQEFFDDVRIPAEDVVGEVDAGWTVVRGLLEHERNSMGGGSPYVSGPSRAAVPIAQIDLMAIARSRGSVRDPHVRQLVAEAHVLGLVQDYSADRVASAMKRGKLPPTAGALIRLMGARHGVRRSDIALELAGERAVVWEPDDIEGVVGTRYLARQSAELGGGSTEIQRNIISERVLGMPREPAADRGVPFNQVRRSSKDR